MYKKIIMFALVFSLIAFVIFLKPSFPRSFHHFWTNNTNLMNENINGLYLFNNIHDKKFIRKYGKQNTKSQNNNLYNYYMIQDGTEIATNNKGEIVRFLIENGIPTIKGIKVGDTIAKVKTLYGDKFYKRTEQGTDIIGYVDKRHHQSLEFWYTSENRIVMYRLDDLSMD